MTVRSLVYLGRADPSLRSADEPDEEVTCEGEPLIVDAAFELKRRRSPWSSQRTHERVIVGSHPGRADVLLVGSSIHSEHVRFYFPRDAEGPMDMMVLRDDSVAVNGEPIAAHSWTTLQGGEEISLGAWRWRYEWSATD